MPESDIAAGFEKGRKSKLRYFLDQMSVGQSKGYKVEIGKESQQ